MKNFLTKQIKSLCRLVNRDHEDETAIDPVRKEDDESSSGGTMTNEPSLKVYFAIALSETMEQLEWATQATFTTTLFLKLGASPELASLAWLPSPMLSLFLAPYIGHLSDGCTHKWGRRRIFLASISIFIIAGLITIPLAAEYISNQRLALVIVIIANFIVDVANQLFDQTQRALAFDLTPEKYQPKVHSIIATSVGFGNVLGSFLGFIDYSFLNADVNDEMFLFLIGCGLFILGLPPILIFAKEEPLAPRTLDDEKSEELAPIPSSGYSVNDKGTFESIGEFATLAESPSDDDSAFEMCMDRETNYVKATTIVVGGFVATTVQSSASAAREGARPSIGGEKPSLVRRDSTFYDRRRSSALINTLVLKEPSLLSRKTSSTSRSSSTSHLASQFASRRASASPFLLEAINIAVKEEQRECERRMTLALASTAAVGPDPTCSADVTSNQPQTTGIVEFYRSTQLPFFKVCFCQFLSYSAVIVYFTYTTSYFAVNIYGGDPSAELGTEENELYTAGIRQGALASCWVSMLSSITAAFIPSIVKLIGVRNTFCGAQVVGGMCWIGAYFVRQPWPTTVLMGGMGFVWASCTTIPYLFVGKYVAPANVGFAVGILSICQLSFSVLIVSTTFGTFISLAGNDFGLALLIGAVFVFISGTIQWFVPYDEVTDEEEKMRDDCVSTDETSKAMDSTMKIHL